MNWLQKACQALPPTYLDVGHGYRWNEETNEREEIWRAKNAGDIILWYYKDGQLQEQEEGIGAHWVEHDDARGRIETNNNRGSIDLINKKPDVQRRVLSDLVDKYPEVKFVIYGSGGPFSLQEYWELIT